MAPAEQNPVEHRLARLLDSPLLARVVPHLAPETLHRLVQYRGLDACGELVTSATPAQLTSLLDLDLWHDARPGGDERFDVHRFGEWLEVLVDAGDSVAARTVAALDEHLVIAGLSRYLRVFDPGTFEPTEGSDDEPRDRDEMMNSETNGDVLECEVGGYLVRAPKTDVWDAIVALLAALEAEQNPCFQAVMRGCRRLSNSRPEIDGLDDLLLAPEQHLHDVAVERERRRTRLGYATAADARAFLQMARQPHQRSHPPGASAGPMRSTSTPGSSSRTPPPPSPVMTTNPIARAYFRAAEEDADEAHDVSAANREDSAESDISSSVEEVIELLAEAGMMPQGPRALLEAAHEDPRTDRLPLLRRLMEFVLHADEALYLTRSHELAFLANTLLAGSSVQSRAFTPQEASDAAACICNLGIECWPGRWPQATSVETASERDPGEAIPRDTFLVDHDLVTAFEVGWSVLYQDVSLFVTDQLLSALADLDCADADTRRDLHALRRTLEKQKEAGTPWLARDATDVLGMLDMTVWVAVLGLLDECPIMPAALRAVLDRRTSAVSPRDFEFISRAGDLGDVRVFVRTLPRLLAG